MPLNLPKKIDGNIEPVNITQTLFTRHILQVLREEIVKKVGKKVKIYFGLYFAYLKR